MRTLELAASKIATDSDALRYSVSWRAEGATLGRIVVTIRDKFHCAADVAPCVELFVAQYLLEQLNVFGRAATGEGLTLAFSSPALVKYPDREWASAKIQAYAFFLRTRFSQANVQKLDRSQDWLKIASEAKIRELEMARPWKERMELYGVGEVEVSNHAIERFLARFNASSGSVGFRALLKAASNPKVTEISLPEYVVARKSAKYGERKMAQSRYFVNPENQLYFVLEDKRIVTTFFRFK